MTIARKEYLLKIHFLILDLLAVALSLVLAIYLRNNLLIQIPFISVYLKPGKTLYYHYINILPYVLIICAFFYRYFGMYKLEFKDEFFSVFPANIFATSSLLAISFFYRDHEFSRAIAMTFFVLSTTLILIFRFTFRKLRMMFMKIKNGNSKILIVGVKSLVDTLKKELAKKELVIDNEIISIPDTKGNPVPVMIDTRKLTNIVNSIEKKLKSNHIKEVWTAFPYLAPDKLNSFINLFAKYNVKWKIVPNLYDIMLGSMQVDSVSGVPLISPKYSQIRGINALIKRGMDIILSFILLTLFSIPMLLIAILIKLTSRGPIIFKQKRAGKKGKLFNFYKFRTMYHNVSEIAHKEYVEHWIKNNTPAENKQKPIYKLKNDKRIIPIGKLLRKFSLDELPQLFNVLKGDMSLVGPRPPMSYEVEMYNEWHKKRLDVKPGITGLWQVSGRNLLSFDDMVKLDIYYIENWSFWMDLKIILKTAFIMFHIKSAF